MNCAVCNRPLFEGATACIVCGAPVAPPPATMPMGSAGAPAPPPLVPATDAYAPTHFVPQPPPPPIPAAAPRAYDPSYASGGYAAPRGPTYSPHYPPPAAPPFPSAYGPGAYGAPLVNAPNHLATLSFVCGLLGLVPLWIGFVLCIVAIVCGGFGIQQAARLPGQRGKGLAIAGLVLGIVFLVPAGCGL